MAFEIYPLPAAHRLEHLDVQYFHNDPKPGVSEHMLKVQYRTHKGKEQKFVIPVCADAKRLGRKLRSMLGTELAAEIIQQFKDYGKLGVKPMFGFRQITLTKRTDKGGRIFQRQQDVESFCWFLLHPDDTLEVRMAWAGEAIKVTLTPHTEVTSDGQSLAIGYWNRTEHLKNKMENMSGNVQGEACGTDASGKTSPEGSEAGSGIAGSEGHRAGVELAAVGGQRKADQVGSDYQVSVARKEREHKGEGPRLAGRVAAKPTGSRNQPARKRSKGSGMDSPEWGVWQPQDVPRYEAGLGTQIRL